LKKRIAIAVVLGLVVLFVALAWTLNSYTRREFDESPANVPGTGIVLQGEGMSDTEKAAALSNSLYLHLDPDSALHRRLIDRFDEIEILPGEGRGVAADDPARPVKIHTWNVPESSNGRMSYTLTVVTGLVQGTDECLFIGEYRWLKTPFFKWGDRIYMELHPAMFERTGKEEFNSMITFWEKKNQSVRTEKPLGAFSFEGQAAAKAPLPLKLGAGDFIAQYWVSLTPTDMVFDGMAIQTLLFYAHAGSAQQGRDFTWECPRTEDAIN